MLRIAFKESKKIISLLLTLVLMLGCNVFSVYAEETASSASPPAGYQPMAPPMAAAAFRGLQVMADNPMILLIEDVSPWSATSHHGLLQSMGTVDKISSSAVSQTDLSRYDAVILSNDQLTNTYNNYAGFKPALEQYVMSGGVLVFGAADRGWNSGSLNQDLPGGLIKRQASDNNNVIANNQHPIVTAELTDAIALTDSDLRSNSCSHTVFDEGTIPAGGSVILRDRSGRPTLVEYPLGTGTVIASGLTWEFGLEHAQAYGFGAYGRKALKDVYAYALNLSSGQFFFSISSAIVERGDLCDITVSMKNNPGMAGFSMEFAFDNMGGHLKPVSITPANEFTSIYSNLDNENAGAGTIDWSELNTITAVWANPTDILIESTDLFTVQFEVSNNAEVLSYPLTLNGWDPLDNDPEGMQGGKMVVNEKYEELEYSTKLGSITVMEDPDVLYGDILVDQFIDIKDAVKLSQYLIATVTLPTRYERLAADVHSDGVADIKDAVKLSQYLAGYDNIELGLEDNEN